jgi:hypothetical protein
MANGAPRSLGAAAPGVDRGDKAGKRLSQGVRDSLELVPKRGFQGYAGAATLSECLTIFPKATIWDSV